MRFKPPQNPLTCDEARSLMVWYDMADSDLSQDQQDAFESHLNICLACREEYREQQQLSHLLRTYGTMSDDTRQLLKDAGYEEEGEREEWRERTPEEEEVDLKAGWERLKRSSPSLMAACQPNEQRRKTHAFIWRVGQYSAAVAACVAMAIGIGWMIGGGDAGKTGGDIQQVAVPLTETPLPASPVHHHQGEEGGDVQVRLDDLDTLPMPKTDLKALKLASWQEENRRVFQSLTPHVFTTQKVLASQYGIQADYIELLMVSGDIWQFHYDPKQKLGQKFAKLEAQGVRRLAKEYQIEPESFLQTMGITKQMEEQQNWEQPPTESLRVWGEEMLAELEGKEELSQNLPITLLQVGTYLNKTRTAAYLWMKEHLEKTNALLDDHENGRTIRRLVKITPHSNDMEEYLQQLEQQVMAGECVAWSGNKLLVIPTINSCIMMPQQFHESLIKTIKIITPIKIEMTAVWK